MGKLRTRPLIVVAVCAFLVYVAASAPPAAEQPGPAKPGSIDPRRAFIEAQKKFSKPGTCERIEIGDPIAEARRSVARGDLRAFTVFGFTPGDAPGILCPRGDYRSLVSRGGTFVSDMPDACGARAFSNADPDKMRAYNEALAASAQFQRATGCRPATYCEERYGKHGVTGPGTKLDPMCPEEPAIFTGIAQSGTPAGLREALRAYRTRGAAPRDLLTAALVAAAGRAKWDNMKLLASAGADVNGRLTLVEEGRRMDSPLVAIFDQNEDRARQLEMAQWLIARGATVAKSNAHMALTWAASSNDVAAVAFLIGAGASPNAGLTQAELDRLAHGAIATAGGGYGYGLNGFYCAIQQAMLRRSKETAEDRSAAAAEQHKAEVNAVRLYQAGGRFVVGMAYDQLADTPNLHIASILIAAAGREGRSDELLSRMLEDVGRLRQPTSAQVALRRYLETVRDCPRRRDGESRPCRALCIRDRLTSPRRLPFPPSPKRLSARRWTRRTFASACSAATTITYGTARTRR